MKPFDAADSQDEHRLLLTKTFVIWIWKLGELNPALQPSTNTKYTLPTIQVSWDDLEFDAGLVLVLLQLPGSLSTRYAYYGGKHLDSRSSGL
ncbi:hypothetical protein Cob_v000161 [Colletotrichum orbiculare MAFF 240422]|uniref:Uncharacterized protein n=1 Tax=Colletotrichum orbiculare (strain 104-T / ATCC 96160 / CBS 514.97 / LARS 414 / MAFF 240422) TaxID=1213857 RepID=A0A484G9F0_COLOR|nr:hypothetical protein Cob_v000161 [Colletotrichum orbiculare MAFF 240422]